MAKPLVPDELWELIRPLLPPPKPRRFRYPGRKPIGDREALTGILFVLKTGIPWEDLPAEMGCGCGMSCWRPAPRLAGGRRVVRPAPVAPDQARPRREDRLVAGVGRCHARPGVRRGRWERAEPPPIAGVPASSST